MTRPAGTKHARPGREADAALVAAARGGDREALDALVRRHLPMVYNLVRQALGGDPDVDDVVQDIVLRALRQLSGLRAPGSFRPWLAAIAVHQIGTHLARADLTARRTAPLDAAAWKQSADAEGPALLRVELAGQRRQVRNASRWLSGEDRAVLSLWWLETAGELSRAEVAAALRMSVPHAGVRLQRMRDQLDLSRSIVAALEAMPGCDRLSAAVAEWNGVPSPFWRKRIARHVRSCPACARAAEGSIPAERLLAGIAMLPLPAALGTATWPAAGGRLLSAVRPRPWMVGAAAGVLAVVAALVVVAGRSDPSTPPVLAAPPAATTSPTPPPFRAGRVSLEAANARGQFVAIVGGDGVLAAIGPGSAAAVRRQASFEVVPGLADASCFSLRTADGRHLRHSTWRLKASKDEGTVLYRRDATFCPRNGSVPGSVSLESFNYPGRFLRHIDGEVWLDRYEDNPAFQADASFVARAPLG